MDSRIRSPLFSVGRPMGPWLEKEPPIFSSYF